MTLGNDRMSLAKKAGRSGVVQGEIVAFDSGVAVVTSELSEQTIWADLRKWPPKIVPLHASWTRSAARSREGRWFTLGVAPHGKDRWLRVYARDLGRGKDLALDGKGFEFGFAGFLGESAAALPGDITLRKGSRSSPLSYAPGLFIETDGVMKPGPKVAGGDADKQSGFIKLGDGADLVVKDGRISEWKGDGFAATFKQDLEPNYNAWPMCAIPHGDDGFITISRRVVVHVRRGKPIAKLLETKDKEHYPMLLAPGGGESIIVSLVAGALHRLDVRKKKLAPLDTSVFGDHWFAPVADAPCGVVAVIDQGYALARIKAS
jgi:hypothetical protein